jgi:cell cycle checkpoint protein
MPLAFEDRKSVLAPDTSQPDHTPPTHHSGEVIPETSQTVAPGMDNSPLSAMLADGDSVETDTPEFACKADSTEVIVTMLQTIALDKQQVAMCTVSKTGMKFTVERTNLLQARAYLKNSLFQEFSLTQPSLEFSIDLSVILQCLQIFGQSAHMEMSYGGHGHPLCLLLEDRGVITQCEIKTLDTPGPMEMNFRTSAITHRAIIRSEVLKDAFQDLDVPEADSVSVHMTPDVPYLSMSVDGASCRCQVDFATEQATDVFTAFQCADPVTHRYSLELMKPCVKALLKSDHVNVRANRDGMMSMQHVINAHDGNPHWVEFLLRPKERLDIQTEYSS